MTTMHHSMTGAHARWAVLWIGKKGWVVKEYETDFCGALELFVKVKGLGAKGATLLCRNVGFPPPKKYDMARYNQVGAVWCPYCRQLRRFKHKSGYFIDDVWVPAPNTQCPVCGITTENYHVRKYNPAYGGHNGATARADTAGASKAVRRNGGSKLSDEQRAAKRERARRRREAKR